MSRMASMLPELSIWEQGEMCHERDLHVLGFREGIALTKELAFEL